MARITRWMARRLHGLAARFERLGDGATPVAPPAPRDPEMLALAERYPGAPEHWLRLIADHVGPAGPAAQAPPPISQSPRRAPRNKLHWPTPLSPTPPVRAAQSADGNVLLAAHRPRLAVPASSSSPRCGELPAFAPPTNDRRGFDQPVVAPGPIGRLAQRLFARATATSRSAAWWDGGIESPVRQARPAAIADAPSAVPVQRVSHTPVWLGEDVQAPGQLHPFDPSLRATADAAAEPGTGQWPDLPGARQPLAQLPESSTTLRSTQPYTPIGREPEVMRFDTFANSPRHPWPALPPSEMGAADAEPSSPDEARFRREQMVSQWNA